MPRVLTIGTFDIPHMGHAIFLRQCSRYGDVTVGVNTDQFVEDYKGARPLYDLTARRTLIEMLGYATHPNDSAGLALICAVAPDFLIIGDDWREKDYPAQVDMTRDEMLDFGIELVYLPYTLGISTSDIRRRVIADRRTT